MSTVTCMPPTSPSANSKEALSVSRWRGQFPSSSLPFFLSLCRNELPATSCASSSIPQTMYAVGATQPAGGVGQRADPLADHLGVRAVRLELNPLGLGVVAAKLLHEQRDADVGTHVTPSSQTYGQYPLYSRPRPSIRPATPRRAGPATSPTGTFPIPFGPPADKQRTPSRTPPTSRSR